MEALKALWRYLTTSRYTIMLEDEVSRLREENRGLLNSLLTRAGVSPIDIPKPVPREGRRMSRHQMQAYLERKATQLAPDA